MGARVQHLGFARGDVHAPGVPGSIGADTTMKVFPIAPPAPAYEIWQTIVRILGLMLGNI